MLNITISCNYHGRKVTAPAESMTVASAQNKAKALFCKGAYNIEIRDDRNLEYVW